MRSDLASLQRNPVARLGRPCALRFSLGVGLTIALIVSFAMWAAILFGAVALLER
jgi:hypothetical protein